MQPYPNPNYYQNYMQPPQQIYSQPAVQQYQQPSYMQQAAQWRTLEDEKSHMSLLDDELEIYKSAINDAIEIVKAGVKYDD